MAVPERSLLGIPNSAWNWPVTSIRSWRATIMPWMYACAMDGGSWRAGGSCLFPSSSTALYGRYAQFVVLAVSQYFSWPSMLLMAATYGVLLCSATCSTADDAQ